MSEPQLPPLTQASYVKESALALWEGFPRVILAGGLFTLASLPAVLLVLFGYLLPAILVGIFTMGPGWAALCDLVNRVIEREPGGALQFVRAFGKFFLRGGLFGAFLAVPLSAAALTLPSLATPPVPGQVWAGLAADLAGLLLLACLYLYAFPILVRYDSTVRVALRNSLLLAARYLVNTLGLIGMAVLLGFLAAKVSWFLLVILPACWLVFVINNCRMVLEVELKDQN